MNATILGALAVLGMAQQTDTVFPVGDATLLDVQSVGGSIAVDVWERSEVRIRAEHSRRTLVDVRRRGRRISVEPSARRGPGNLVDFQITVPATMDLKVEGMMVSITVDGAGGEVEAETLDGDVTVRGGRGTLKVATMTGTVRVEGAEGLIDVESAAGSVHILDSSGEILGESMGGDIVMEGVRATAVDVGSVGGAIWYDGTFDAGGTYFFGSHGGPVTLVVPEGTAAHFDLATIHGPVYDNLEGEMRRAESGRRHTLEIGGGGAIVEVETFGGRIDVVRKGTEGEVPRGRRDRHPMPGMDFDYDLTFDVDSDLEGLGGYAARVAAEASAGVSAALRTQLRPPDRRHRR